MIINNIGKQIPFFENEAYLKRRKSIIENFLIGEYIVLSYFRKMSMSINFNKENNKILFKNTVYILYK